MACPRLHYLLFAVIPPSSPSPLCWQSQLALIVLKVRREALDLFMQPVLFWYSCCILIRAPSLPILVISHFSWWSKEEMVETSASFFSFVPALHCRHLLSNESGFRVQFQAFTWALESSISYSHMQITFLLPWLFIITDKQMWKSASYQLNYSSSTAPNQNIKMFVFFFLFFFFLNLCFHRKKNFSK